MAATIKVTNVQEASSATVNLALDSSGNVTVGNNLTVTGTSTLTGNVTATGTVAMGSSFKRNRIINGNMAVAQRGTSFSSPSGYTVDRWGIGYTGSAPASAAQVAGPSGYQYALQVTGAAGNTIVAIYQPIESKNCADLVGKSITISVTIFCSTAQTVGWNLFYANSADSFGSSTSIQTGSWAVGTTAQRFTATINNLPAGAANGLQLNIQPNNFGAFISGTITITGVQLEVGTVATPYEMQIYSDQLAQCQRYYVKLGMDGSAFGSLGNGICYANNGGQGFVVRLPVTMRTQPTPTASNMRVYDGAAAAAVTSITGATACSNANALGFDVGCSGTVLTPYRPLTIQGNNNTAAYIEASAEL